MRTEPEAGNHQNLEIALHAKSLCADLVSQMGTVYVGPSAVPELMLVALISNGHVLLEGVPGLAKTTLCKTFAGLLGCHFRRVQFTPDLLPADITGSYIFSPKDNYFLLREGPVFTHILLGDEINRAPAKTQSALLEAMQEKQVTIEGETRNLPEPFMVLATQNPIEQAGTYPLPEAQLDRFLLRIAIGYPTETDEQIIVKRSLGARKAPAQGLTREQVLWLCEMATQIVHVDDAIINYAVSLAARTRSDTRVVLGLSPRATVGLINAARSMALIRGRAFVSLDDVKDLAIPVLAHRLVLSEEAFLDGVRGDHIIASHVAAIPARRIG